MEKNCNFCLSDSCGLLQSCLSNLQLMRRREKESEKLPGSVQRARRVARAERFAQAVIAHREPAAAPGERDASEGEC